MALMGATGNIPKLNPWCCNPSPNSSCSSPSSRGDKITHVINLHFPLLIHQTLPPSPSPEPGMGSVHGQLRCQLGRDKPSLLPPPQPPRAISIPLTWETRVLQCKGSGKSASSSRAAGKASPLPGQQRCAASADHKLCSTLGWCQPTEMSQLLSPVSPRTLPSSPSPGNLVSQARGAGKKTEVTIKKADKCLVCPDLYQPGLARTMGTAPWWPTGPQPPARWGVTHHRPGLSPSTSPAQHTARGRGKQRY